MPPLIREVADRLGVSPELAERWIAERLDGASGPVRNVPAFIRTCLDRADATSGRRRASGRGTPAVAIRELPVTIVDRSGGDPA